MQTSPTSTLNSIAHGLRARSAEDVMYQVGTLGAILLVLSCILIF